jgi:acyl-coenzyme A synthetase/AMP-(fatty) acid ligase
VLIFDGEGLAEKHLTFGEMESRVNRLARNLQSNYGIMPGDRVVTVADNRPEMVSLTLACLKIGAINVPLATELMPVHLLGMVDNFEPSLVIAETTGAVTTFPKPDGGEWTTLLMPLYGTGGGLEDLESAGSDEPFDITANHEDCNIIFSTSGSTGIPKGVMYSGMTCAMLGKLLPGARARNDPVWSSLTEDDTQLLWVPMRGVVGSAITLAFMAEGMTSVMIGTSPNTPDDWVSGLQVQPVYKVF